MKRSSYQLALLALGLWLLFTGALATHDTNLTAEQKRLQKIEASMDLEYEPCNDFFNYACKNWKNHQYNQTDFPHASHTIEVLESRVKDEIRTFFEQGEQPSDPKFLVQISKYYRGCMDATKEDTQPLQYLKWLSVYEGIKWPILEAGNDTQAEWVWDWIEMLATLRKYGFNDILFHQDVVPSKDDALKMTIALRRAPLVHLNEFMSQDYPVEQLVEGKTVDTLNNFQIELTLRIGEHIRNHEKSDFKHLLDNVMNPSDTEATLVSLKDLQLPWLNQYFSVLLNRTDVDPNMQLYVDDVKYLTMIYDFVNRHDNGLVCDYILFKFLIFLREQNGFSSNWQCIGDIRRQFPLAMQWIYKSKHPEVQQEYPAIENLFNNLKSNFKADIQANTFSFSDEILDYLEAKVDKLQLSIFDISRDDLETYYQQLYLSSTEYCGNFLRLSIFKFQFSLSALDKTPARNSVQLLDGKRDVVYEHSDIILYNLPYLNHRLNTVFLPVTMLQDPFHAHGWGDVYTYSTIGFHLALEIKRAFDPRHVGVDANGLYQSAMSEEILNNPKYYVFTSRMRIDFEQYHDVYDVVNDIGALQLAYDTLADLHPDVLQQSITMHNSSMTMDQVFFLSYAQNFCTFSCMISPMEYTFYDVCKRVGESVGHVDKFGHAFQCK